MVWNWPDCVPLTFVMTSYLEAIQPTRSLGYKSNFFILIVRNQKPMFPDFWLSTGTVFMARQFIIHFNSDILYLHNCIAFAMGFHIYLLVCTYFKGHFCPLSPNHIDHSLRKCLLYYFTCLSGFLGNSIESCTVFSFTLSHSLQNKFCYMPYYHGNIGLQSCIEASKIYIMYILLKYYPEKHHLE